MQEGDYSGLVVKCGDPDWGDQSSCLMTVLPPACGNFSAGHTGEANSNLLLAPGSTPWTQGVTST